MVLREGSFFAAGQAFGVQRVPSSLIRQWAGFGGSKRFFYFQGKTPNPCPLYVYDVTIFCDFVTLPHPAINEITEVAPISNIREFIYTNMILFSHRLYTLKKTPCLLK